jgi:hypothetical protein
MSIHFDLPNHIQSRGQNEHTVRNSYLGIGELRCALRTKHELIYVGNCNNIIYVPSYYSLA